MITWRNMPTTNFNSGNSLIKAGSDSIGDGIKALQQSAQDIQDSEISEYNKEGLDNTTQAFNQLSQLKADDTQGRVDLLKSFAGQNIDHQALARANASQSGTNAIHEQLKLDATRENIANQKAIDSFLSFDSSGMSVKDFSSELQRVLRDDELLTENQKSEIYTNQFKKFGDSLALAAQEAQLNKLNNPVIKPNNSWTKLDANTLYNKETGETKALTNTGSSDSKSNINPDTGKPYTIAQNKAYGFYERANKSRAILDELVSNGYNPADLVEKAKAGTPLIGNIVASKEHQKYYQALDDILKAVLRDESGAAIPDSEIASYRETYSPRIGDSAEVVIQKRNSLDALINQFKVKSGKRDFSNDTSINRSEIKFGAQPSAGNSDVPEGTTIVLDAATKAAYDKYGVSY